MIEIINLSKKFNDLEILKNINFNINRGDSLAITGKSGTGKSTLLSLLAGLDISTAGKVLINQIDLNQLSEDARAKLRGELISFIFQDFQLISSLTALENVLFALEIHPHFKHLSHQELKNKATQQLEAVSLTQRLNHYPKQLSGGEQQRVALARAFVVEPKILFADEPTGNLDSQTAQQIIDLMFDLNTKHQTTLILVTHDLDLAKKCKNNYILS